MLKRKGILLFAVLFILNLLIPAGLVINVGADGCVGAVQGELAGDVLKYTVTNDGSSGNHYLYQSFSNLSYTFQAGDYIEYDVRIDVNKDGVGGIDIFTTDGLNFRDISPVDQNGLGMHPASDISNYAYKTVYHRKIVQQSLKTKTRYLVIRVLIYPIMLFPGGITGYSPFRQAWLERQSVNGIRSVKMVPEI